MKVIRIRFCGGITFLLDLVALDSINAHPFSASVKNNADFFLIWHRNIVSLPLFVGLRHYATGDSWVHKNGICFLCLWSKMQNDLCRKALVQRWEPFLVYISVYIVLKYNPYKWTIPEGKQRKNNIACVLYCHNKPVNKHTKIQQPIFENITILWLINNKTS